MRSPVPGPHVLLLSLLGACASDPASTKADEGPPAPDDSGEPPAPDCGRGSPSQGLTAEATISGDAFSGDLWTCSVRDLVDPIGDGVTIAYDLRSDIELEVVEETADGITVVVPFPEDVGGGLWGQFEWAGCFVTVTDSAGCSVEVSSASEDSWHDPRAEAGVSLTVRTDSSTGEPIRYISASWDSDPPSGPWAPPAFDWYRNGELVASVTDGRPFVLFDFEAGDEIRTTILHVREDGLELRGEARLTVPAI